MPNDILIRPINDVSDLFEEQFSISQIKENANEGNSKFDTAIRLIKSAFLANDLDVDDGEQKYVVELTDELKEKLANGEIHFAKKNNGELMAQLKDSNEKIFKNLSITEEIVEAGLSMGEFEMMLQMQAIKDQLDKMLDAIASVEQNVERIMQGQKNDRIGLYHSGVSMFLEAQNTKDETLRKFMMAQALQSISDANAQMIQDIRTDLDYLLNERYKKEKDRVKAIDSRISNVKSSYGIVYRASMLKAYIYQFNGELSAMLTALDEYRSFVNTLIVPYTGDLGELDEETILLGDSTWSKISHTLEGCDALKQLAAPRSEYTLISEEV